LFLLLFYSDTYAKTKKEGIKMRQEDWQKVMQEVTFSCEKVYVQKQMAHERTLVESYMLEKGISDYDNAERALAEQGRVLCDLERQITDVHTDHKSEPYGHAGLLPDFMEAARRAIEEFDKRTVSKVTFPNAYFNASALGGWGGCPWSSELNASRVREKFMQNHPNYDTGAGMRGNEFYISFCY
jgi:hypothetical protein